MKKTFSEVLTIKNGKNQKKVENPEGKYPIYGSGGIMGFADNFICEANTVVIGRKGNINNPIFVEEPFWNVDTAFGLEADKRVLLPKYLYYFCKHHNFERYNRTVTIPSLTKSDLLRVKIDLPSLSKQQLIIDRLTKIEDILSKRRKELKNLDTLVKARFVEMFGNIGRDDRGWGLSSLGKACIINPRRPKNINKNGIYSFISMPSVSEHGDMDSSGHKSYEEVKTGFTYFQENDVLFAKITPCMENGKGAVARGLKNGIGFGSTEFHVLRPIDDISNPYWLYEITMQPQFRISAERQMTGTGGQRRVPVAFLENFPISIPPITFQNKFADFVQQVDKSKAAIQKSIDKTQMLFDSLMQEYFS